MNIKPCLTQDHDKHNYAEKLLQKIETPRKQFALILKPNPCYSIMILKYALISIVEKQQKQIELKTQQPKNSK